MPEFTPLQLQLRLRGPKDIDVAMKTTDRVDVTCPELHSRRPFQTKSSSPPTSSSAADSSASNSSKNSGKRKKTNDAYAATSDDANQPPNDTKTTTTNNNNNNNNSHTTTTSPSPPKMTTPSTPPPPPPPSLPPIATLAGAPIKTQMAALDTLFEPSTELHTLVLPALRARHRPGGKEEGATAPAPFGTYGDLIRHVGGQLAALADSPSPEARRKLHGILGSHPRLGAAKVASAQSRAEQAQLQASSAAAEEEARRLADLNTEYETRFPGLRFVVFVNGRGRPAVMTDMRRRIDRGDAAAEEREAIRAMVDIALDRARKLGAAV